MKEIFDAIEAKGGAPFIVGGYVRDSLMGKAPKDMDVEVFGLSSNALVKILERFGKVDNVGKSFGVIKLLTPDGNDYDFSLPRRDSKVRPGHNGFVVEVDPDMTIQEAASRRDFTINAMSMTPHGDLVDPFGGADDLAKGILRHTSDAFCEDPLRVLRGFQFAGRYNLRIHPDTALICRSLCDEYPALPKERIWGEWYKWAAKSVKPSAGLRFLNRAGWLHFYPEITKLMGLPQEPAWHPEGSVYIHTQYTCDAAAEIADRYQMNEEDRAALVFGALCHDMGKFHTTRISDGRITSHGHDEAGVWPARCFMKSIGAPDKFTETAVELTKYHMRHIGDTSPRTARRLLAEMQYATTSLLMVIFESDHSARPPLPKGMPESGRKLIDLMIDVMGEVKPILQGRHLIAMGMTPGPKFGEILKDVYERQLDGEIYTLGKAIDYVDTHYR